MNKQKNTQDLNIFSKGIKLENDLPPDTMMIACNL